MSVTWGIYNDTIYCLAAYKEQITSTGTTEDMIHIKVDKHAYMYLHSDSQHYSHRVILNHVDIYHVPNNDKGETETEKEE